MFSKTLLNRTVKENFRFLLGMTIALSVLLISQIAIVNTLSNFEFPQNSFHDTLQNLV